MTSFELTQQDVLLMSLAAHGCLLVQLLLNKALSRLAPLLSSRGSMMRTLMDVHDGRPGLLARILMEQLTLWTLVLLILISLTYTSLPLHPFSHQPFPYPSFLIRLILSISVARFVVMATRIALVPEVVRGGRQSSTCRGGQSGHPRLDLLYNLFSGVTNLLCLGYHQNLLLGVTSSFMEISSTPLECRRLIKLAGNHQGSKSYRKTTILSCAVCSFFRVALPVVFLILATCQESPSVMSELPLIWFFLSGVFYFTFNLCLVSQSIRKVAKVIQSPAPSSPYYLSTSPQPFPTPIHPEIHPSDVLDNKNDSNGNSYHHLKELTLPSSENGDMSHLAAQKTKISKKKETSKHNLLSRLVRAGDEGFPRAFCLTGRFCKNMGRTSSNDHLLKCPSEAGDNNDLDPLSSPELGRDRDNHHYGALEDQRQEGKSSKTQSHTQQITLSTASYKSYNLQKCHTTNMMSSIPSSDSVQSVESILGDAFSDAAPSQTYYAQIPCELVGNALTDLRTGQKLKERGDHLGNCEPSPMASVESAGVSFDNQASQQPDSFSPSTNSYDFSNKEVNSREMFSPVNPETRLSKNESTIAVSDCAALTLKPDLS